MARRRRKVTTVAEKSRPFFLPSLQQRAQNPNFKLPSGAGAKMANAMNAAARAAAGEGGKEGEAEPLPGPESGPCIYPPFGNRIRNHFLTSIFLPYRIVQWSASRSAPAARSCPGRAAAPWPSWASWSS